MQRITVLLATALVLGCATGRPRKEPPPWDLTPHLEPFGCAVLTEKSADEATRSWVCMTASAYVLAIAACAEDEALCTVAGAEQALGREPAIRATPLELELPRAGRVTLHAMQSEDEENATRALAADRGLPADLDILLCAWKDAPTRDLCLTLFDGVMLEGR